MAHPLSSISSISGRLLAVTVILLAACNNETPKPRDATLEKAPGAGAPESEKDGPGSPGAGKASTPTAPPNNPAPTAPAAPAKPVGGGKSADAGTPGAGAAAAAPAGAAATAAPLSGKLATKVLYLERMMIPPDCTVKVQLADVSRADAAAVVLSEKSSPTKGAPPYAFELTYDPAKIDPRNTYAVSARIEKDGKLMYTSDTRHAVLTHGAPTDAVEVIVKRVQEPEK